ncbi:glycoside hydrolase N-terminal domain-containing protein [Vibrio penaeicida]|uniref:glycosyl hydrolase family 95 catalytic domain-containing protein n=1 Tax=Vibrio penaeicida TaxID=104609 RepID=UPI002734BB9A|nr:glycoside hydrolase N-terminal domain-containing protein [Vibrio penaeicida]MDP2572243.1 glycoside hydrolase N-terminal domain-containing protein [Vibrio penaeicida]
MKGFQPKINNFYGIFLLFGLLSTQAYGLPVQSISKDSNEEIAQFSQQGELYFNSAKGKVTKQSSTAFNGYSFSAVDGNTSGVYQQHSITHTSFESKPWWTVDLGQSENIEKVRIWNRTDCCSNRLGEFYVLTSNTPLDSVTLDQATSSNDTNVYRVDSTDTQTQFNLSSTFRYLKILKDNSSYLSLGEVEIFRLKTARESATVGGSLNWVHYASVDADSANSNETSAQGGDSDLSTKWLSARTSGQGGDSDLSTKWLSARTSGQAIYNIDLPEGVTRPIRSYTLISGNDAPQRDPESWQLQGTNDGSNWTTLDSRTDQYFPDRHWPKTYQFTNEEAYGQYRLAITPKSGDQVQFAEVALCEIFCNVNDGNQGITANNLMYQGAIEASSEWALGGQSADALIDGDEVTKWISRRGDDTPIISMILPQAKTKAVRYYSLTSGNDVPSRDPTSWVLEGSDNGRNWEVLDIRANQSFDSRKQTRHFNIADAQAYSRYRLPLQSNGGDTFYQLTDIALCQLQCNEADNPRLKSALTIGANASADMQGPVHQGPETTLNGGVYSKWYTGRGGSEHWLQVDLENGKGYGARQYQITSAGDVPSRDPANWQLQGSNDGSEWRTLDTRNDITFENRYQTQTFSTRWFGTYRHYRLIGTSQNGDDLQLSEFVLCPVNCSSLASNEPHNLQTDRFSIQTPGNNDSTNPLTTVDNTDNWQSAGDINAPATVLFSAANSAVSSLNSYALRAPSDVGEQTLSWTVWGSLDGENWTLVDVKFDQTLTDTPSYFGVPDQNLYSKLRVEFQPTSQGISLSYAGFCQHGGCPSDLIGKPNGSDWMLWYTQPATVLQESVHLGNGPIGISVYGGVEEERFLINEHQIWAGSPFFHSKEVSQDIRDQMIQSVFNKDYPTTNQLFKDHFRRQRPIHYQLAGNLRVATDVSGDVSNYRRALDINTAVAEVSFIDSKGAQHTRETFTSFKDPVMVSRFKVDGGVQDLSFSYDSPLPITVSTRKRTVLSAEIIMDGQNTDGNELYIVPGEVKFRSKTIIKAVDGEIDVVDDKVIVRGTTEVQIWSAVDTNVTDYKALTTDEKAQVDEHLTANSMMSRNFDNLLARHLSVYQPMFQTLNFDFPGKENGDTPTDLRRKNFRNDSDQHMAALLTQYSRYALLSSSFNSEPANLQGRWNDKTHPLWWSDYHLDINLAMNYMAAENLNLVEAHKPLFQFIYELAEQNKGYAKEIYGIDNGGWVAHIASDMWRNSPPVRGIHGQWVQGGTWISMNLWEHYLYNPDINFLREIYPTLKGAALFFDELLQTHPDSGNDELVHTWSTSPENKPEGRDSDLQLMPTMDVQLLHQLYDIVIEASTTLNTDSSLRSNWQSIKSRLPNPAPIGRLGRIQEWYEDIDKESDQHRHISHLYGAGPGWSLDLEDSTVRAAVVTSMENRGSGGTGWASPWRGYVWARLGETPRAYQQLENVISSHSYPDLTVNVTGVTQVDGLFGGGAVVAEMLMQSHRGSIDLLPSVPDTWTEGKVEGLRARRGFTLTNLEWKNGVLVEAAIKSEAGKPLTVRYNGQSITVNTTKGQTYKVDASLNVY